MPKLDGTISLDLTPKEVKRALFGGTFNHNPSYEEIKTLMLQNEDELNYLISGYPIPLLEGYPQYIRDILYCESTTGILSWKILKLQKTSIANKVLILGWLRINK